MWLLLASLALADPGADPLPVAAPAVVAPPAEAPPAFATVEDNIDEAIRVRRGGDPEAARALLVELEPLVPVDLLPWYLYQRGICEEVAWRPDSARAFYDQVITLGGDVALDARFRRALVLEDMGQSKAALDEILALDRVRGLSPDDEITIALQRGITELEAGRRIRGIRHVEKALAATEGSDSHRYLRAKARYHLARALFAEADAQALTGPERRVVKRLEARAVRIKAAEAQIIALTTLQEPEWVLASLISLGDSYARLATDLAASAPPKRLSVAQAEVYRAELAKKVANVRTKAFHCYDQGVAVATRLAWESPRVGTLKERRETLQATR